MAGKKKATTSGSATRANTSRTQNNADNAPPPSVVEALNRMLLQVRTPYEQIVAEAEAFHARHFMPVVERVMEEIEADRRRIKGKLREIVGDKGVPVTPKRNKPGALAWQKINEWKQKRLDFDGTLEETTDFLDETVEDHTAPASEMLRTPRMPPRNINNFNDDSVEEEEVEVTERVDDSQLQEPSEAATTDSPRPGPSGAAQEQKKKARATKSKTPATAPVAVEQSPHHENKKTARVIAPVVVEEPPQQHLLLTTPVQAAGGQRKRPQLADKTPQQQPLHTPKLTAAAAKAKEEEEERKRREEAALARHEEQIEQRKQNAKRRNDECKMRVEKNRREQEQKKREEEEALRAHNERIRQFQEQQRMEQQQRFSPHHQLGAATAGPSSLPRTPGRMPMFMGGGGAPGPSRIPLPKTPGQRAVPPKKQKATAAAPIINFGAVDSPIKAADAKRKQPRRQLRGAAAAKKADEKVQDSEAAKLDIEMKAVRAQEAKEKTRKKEMEEAERLRRQQEKEAAEEERRRREAEEEEAARQPQEPEPSTAANESSHATGATYTVNKSVTHRSLEADTITENTVGSSFPTFTVHRGDQHIDLGEPLAEQEEHDDAMLTEAERSFAALQVKEEPEEEAEDLMEQEETQPIGGGGDYALLQAVVRISNMDVSDVHDVPDVKTDVIADTFVHDSHQEIDLEVKENQAPVGEEQSVVNDSTANQSTYDMTLEKVFLPSTEDNYNVDDLSSNDETDDEEHPRKTVPRWAQKNELCTQVLRMRSRLPEKRKEQYFGRVEQPSVEQFFEKTRKKFKARSSSAVWNSPMAEPTRGVSRFRQMNNKH